MSPVDVVLNPEWQGYTDAAALEFMESLTDLVKGGALRLVPIGDSPDGEHLYQSIDNEAEVVEPGLVVGRVSSGDPDVGRTMDYAEVVENGREDMPNYPAQPYLKPALYQYQGGDL